MGSFEITVAGLPLSALAAQLTLMFGDNCSTGALAYCWWDDRLYVLHSSGDAGATDGVDLRTAVVGLHFLPGRDRYRTWPHSSYAALVCGCLPLATEERLLELFGGWEEFMYVHSSFP